jgi:hypothetical protein
LADQKAVDALAATHSIDSCIHCAAVSNEKYARPRRAAIEGVIEADPVAAFVREIMAVRSTWTGRASHLLRARTATGENVPDRTAGWPKNPRALAGRLRRCQTFLRTVGMPG